MVTMLIDHLGAFFFPDIEALRIIGRMSMPVWLFLAGYSRSGHTYLPFLLGAAFLAGVAAVSGWHVFPLSILLMIVVVKLYIPMIGRFVGGNHERFVLVCFAAMALSHHSSFFVEYGTLCFIPALLGYLSRHRDDLTLTPKYLDCMAIAGWLAVSVFTLIRFSYGPAANILMLMGVLGVFLGLMRFRSGSVPDVESRLPVWVLAAIQMAGRRTLVLYVGHLALFMVIRGFMAAP
jgi:hypothetical protein